MVLTRFRPILQKFADHHADFIVVGGIAALIHAAPILTLDLDIVHSRDPENIPRLLRALNELDAFYRIQPHRRFRPAESHLLATGHQLLTTDFGPLDLLGTIGSNRSYPDLLPHSKLVSITESLQVRVLDLETLIATKEEAGRDKDLAVLPTLRATLAEIRRRTVETSTTSGCG
jgi:hypothetical protein